MSNEAIRSKRRDSKLTHETVEKPATKPNQRNTKYSQRFTVEAAKSETAESEAKTKISKLQHEAETASEKLERLRDKSSNLSQKTIGEVGSATDNRITQITQAGAAAVHRKISEVEKENVGTESAHKTEYAAEQGYSAGKRVVNSAIRHARSRPLRQTSKLEGKATRANAKLAYQKAVKENPKLQSNVLSRHLQKRRIKKQYAKSARNAKSGYQRAAQAGKAIGKGVQKVIAAIAKSPKLWAIIAIILLIFFILSAFMSSLSFLLGGVNNATAGTYLADDDNITAASVLYTKWETDLRLRIENVEHDYPGYDGYRYNIGNIRHDPFVLMAYLTAVFGEFNVEDITEDMQNLFNMQYNISFTVEGRILYVTLTSLSLPDVIAPLMNQEQSAVYEICMESRGNRQFVGSVISGDWIPNVTDLFGYRVHPIRGGLDFHNGIDIAMPTGTELRALHDGVVTTRYDKDGYGIYIIVESYNGLRSLYAHCDSLLYSNGQIVNQGDVIAISGNTGGSTGPHLHLELRKNGVLMNPIYFMETGG